MRLHSHGSCFGISTVTNRYYVPNKDGFQRSRYAGTKMEESKKNPNTMDSTSGLPDVHIFSHTVWSWINDLTKGRLETPRVVVWVEII